MGDIPGYTPPPAELQKRANQAIVRPDHVGGTLGGQTAVPDRVFHLLETRKDGPDRVWQAEGYCIKDGTTGQLHWKIHLLCPTCERGLTIDSQKKTIEVTDRGLQTEPFGCNWHGDFGQLRCTFNVAIRHPKNKDEALVRCDHDPMNPRKIDGVFVRA